MDIFFGYPVFLVRVFKICPFAVMKSLPTDTILAVCDY
jgi:hypothetical protein